MGTLGLGRALHTLPIGLSLAFLLCPPFPRKGEGGGGRQSKLFDESQVQSMQESISININLNSPALSIADPPLNFLPRGL